MSEEGNRRAKIIILSILLAIVLISIATFSTILIVKKIKKDKPAPPPVVTPPPEEENNNIFTNSYNEAIAKKILTTNDYSGTYVYCDEIDIGLYWNESLTEEERRQIQLDKGCSEQEIISGTNAFKRKIIQEKIEKSQGEVIEIKKPYDSSTGTNKPYGFYNIKKNSQEIQNGKVYGDKNLAVIVNDSNQNIHTFISLNYKLMHNAIDVAEITQTLDGKIYMFENTYDNNGKLLYSVSYIYEITQS